MLNDSTAIAAAFQFAGQDIPTEIAHWAARRPDHPLLIWEPRNGRHRIWSYAQFWLDVRRLAAGLHARGVRQGDCVLIHSANCPEMVLSWYACAVVGAIAVTTNTHSVADEIRYFTRVTRPVAAITQPTYAALIKAHAEHIRWLAVTADNSGEPPTTEESTHGGIAFEALFGDADAAPMREPEPMLRASIMFTSGTTSLPKAVVHTHANFLWAARMGARNISFTGDDVHFAVMPFFHINAQFWSFATAIGVGGSTVLVPKFSASRFWETVLKHSITHLSVPQFIIQAAREAIPPQHSIKVMVPGVTSSALENLFGVKTFGGWGMTETVIHSTYTDVNRSWPDGTIGRPVPGYEMAVVDPETGEPCRPEQMGELWVRGTRGVQLFLEYFDNPQAMQKSFTEDGWFKTGDIVRVGRDGNLYFCDRDKDLLKVGGENVSAAQVEAVILGAGGVQEVAVVAKKHARLDMVPVAFVIRTPDAPPEATHKQAILNSCSTALARFKVPREIYFVPELPRATLNKVAKNKLRELADAMPAIE